MKIFSLILLVALLSACSIGGEPTPDPPTEVPTEEVDPLAQQISVEVNGPESVILPPGDFRYNQFGNIYILNITTPDKVVTIDLQLATGLEPGEYDLGICSAIVEEVFTGVCVNFAAPGLVTSITDRAEGTVVLESTGDTLTGTVEGRLISASGDEDASEYEISITIDAIEPGSDL